MSRRTGYWKVLLLVCLSVGGCQNATKHYTLTGEALAKNESSGVITVDGDDIPGFMPAMTMNYTVKDPQGLQDVQPGDKIQADVVMKSNSNYWLEHLTVTDRSGRGTVTLTAPRKLLRGEKVPDVPLVDQDGKTIHLSDFQGKAVLLTFIYTRCPFPTFCPLISSEFARIHNTLAKNPSIYDKTHLISVSLDPKYDTAPVLRKYGLAYLKGSAAGFAQWSFVSTSPANLKKLASAFGLVYYEENNIITHTMNTILLAPDGTVEETWPGNQWMPSQIIDAINATANSHMLVTTEAKKNGK